MYYVYALSSQKQQRIYVGLTKDIQGRLIEHNEGRVFSTKPYRPWVLFYSQKAVDLKSARLQEKKLKSGFGKELLKEKLKSNT